jgi:hypothetical protein
MKRVLPWLVRWACRAGTRHFGPALAALVGSVQNIFFPHRTLFQFICPYRPASWADSRAGRLTIFVTGHRPRTSQGPDACLRRSSSIVYSSLARGGGGGMENRGTIAQLP